MTRFRLCASLAVSGAIATQVFATRYLPLVGRLSWESWDERMLLGAIGGALIGNVCWVAMNLPERVTRAALLCAAANVLVWISFLIFAPPLTGSEFAEISSRRAGQDSQNGFDLDIVHDVPIVVAGRWSGTWGAVNTADYALHVFAGPAVIFAELVVVPPSFSGNYATKGESYAIAGVAFVLSTSFWMAVGGGMSALRRAYQRRQAAR